MDSIRYLWEPFLTYGQVCKFKKNKVLFRQGERGTGFYYLREGLIKLKLVSSLGQERTVDYLSPGLLTGEPGIRNEPYFTTAVMKEDSILYYFSLDVFQSICTKHPEAANIFMSSLIQKIRLLDEAASLLTHSLEYQIAHFIYKLYLRFESTIIPISQVSLAQYIGTSRISVYKILKPWVEDGIIEISIRTIQIHDIEKFKVILHQQDEEQH